MEKKKKKKKNYIYFFKLTLLEIFFIQNIL